MRPIFALVIVAALGPARAADSDDGFKSMFDGKTLSGWKASEDAWAWEVRDGAIVTSWKRPPGVAEKKNARSHLFYVGEDKPFQNFEWKVDVMTQPRSNGGLYFHTKFQETDWPKIGYEVQVNQTHIDPKKTGGIYGVKDVMFKSPVNDNEWYSYHIIVKGKTITVKVNDAVTAEYTEPENHKADPKRGRRLDGGTFALQGHDPGGVVSYKNLRVKRLD